MSVDQMRVMLEKVYPGEWANKVARMHDNQVIAVYYKFLREGRFNPDFKKERDPMDRLTEITDEEWYGNKPRYKQMTIFDILNERR